jgi:hypothetical protein
MPALIDLAGDEFRKAPLGSPVHLIRVDYWIGWNSDVCTHIPDCLASRMRGAKLRCLLLPWDLWTFDSMERTGAENVMRVMHHEI